MTEKNTPPETNVAGGTPTAWAPLIQALSRMFDSRQADGVSLVSPEDRRTIIDGCHDLMAARHSPGPQPIEGSDDA